MCETTSVTRRFLQPSLKRFSRCPICGASFYFFTFSLPCERAVELIAVATKSGLAQGQGALRPYFKNDCSLIVDWDNLGKAGKYVTQRCFTKYCIDLAM